jgi:hypothetical protein
MSEHEAPQSPPPPAFTVTPTHATTCHIAINNSDFVLVFAIIKSAWNPQQGLVPGGALEPVATVSVSPVVAKQLVRQLSQAVAGFEGATHSTIPEMGELQSSGGMVEPTNTEVK